MELLPILAIFVIFWLLIIRPARNRQKQMDRMQSSVGVGTEIATTGGLFGTVVSVDGEERLGVEVAPGVVVSVARRAVAGVVSEPADATDATDDPRLDDPRLEEPADESREPGSDSGSEPGDNGRA